MWDVIDNRWSITMSFPFSCHKNFMQTKQGMSCESAWWVLRSYWNERSYSDYGKERGEWRSRHLGQPAPHQVAGFHCTYPVPVKHISPAEVKLKIHSSHALAKLNGFPVDGRHHLQGSCQGRNSLQEAEQVVLRVVAVSSWVDSTWWGGLRGQGGQGHRQLSWRATEEKLSAHSARPGRMGDGKLTILSPGEQNPVLQPGERPALTSGKSNIALGGEQGALGLPKTAHLSAGTR